MLESYAFLAQIPENTLIKKQNEVIKKFVEPSIDRRRHLIYFISDGDGTKIGKSDNVLNRIKQLQTGNPRRLILIGITPSRKNTIDDNEKMFHKLNEDKLLRGEWFNLTDSDIYSMNGAQIRFPDYFSTTYQTIGFYKYTHDIQPNINDRIHNNYYKNAY